MKSCFFIGHRNVVSSAVEPLLEEAVERHITEYGVTEFYVGHYGDFDRIAAGVVKEAKQKHPEIQLFLVLPYHPALQPIERPQGFDDTYYPWEHERIPKRAAILKTNQRMVDTCDFLLACVMYHSGGSGTTLEYARKQEQRGLIHIENLAENLSKSTIKHHHNIDISPPERL